MRWSLEEFASSASEKIGSDETLLARSLESTALTSGISIRQLGRALIKRTGMSAFGGWGKADVARECR